VALHLALRVPAVPALLERVVRHDPLRCAHRRSITTTRRSSRSRRRASTATRSRAPRAPARSSATSARR
jgi:hypothetical protein